MNAEPITTTTGTVTSPLHRTAPGVTYTRIDGVPGRFFKCEAYRCSLSVSSCADRWRQAQSATGYDADRIEKCASCPIGAAHNGVAQVYRSPLFGKPICPRARRWTNRLIWNRLGVAAYNRTAEFLRQKDGKGNPPGFRFDPRRLAVVIDGKRVELRDALTADLTEMAVAVLRTVTGRVVFTKPRQNAVAISTIDLARQFIQPASPRPLAGAAAGGDGHRRAGRDRVVVDHAVVRHQRGAPAMAAE